MTDTIKERIVSYMRHSGRDVDVYIVDLYADVYGHYGQPDVPLRSMQQRLGARFTIINREYAAGKQEYGRIVPGKLKRTYRLVKA